MWYWYLKLWGCKGYFFEVVIKVLCCVEIYFFIDVFFVILGFFVIKFGIYVVVIKIDG